MLDVLYLVHDLSDPAVRRRVMTLDAGGAAVTLAGFRRGTDAAAMVAGVRPIELGRTRDAQFAQRAAAVAKAALRLGATLKSVKKPDVIIARNLEMLALANRANGIFGGDVPIAYECLDIHRLLLRADGVGKVFRGAERVLGRNAGLLLTSSPAFVDQYFKRMSGLDLPIVLLENKVIELDHNPGLDGDMIARPPEKGEPWKIGWFGALRCRTSLRMLAEFSRRMEGRFEIVLRGRPAYSELPDFDAFVEAEPFMTFHGPYRNPEDLAGLYRDVQFSWAIDFFEAGQNSDWLLPNRLYEGCRYATVPIGLRGTETARFLDSRNIGLMLDEASVPKLAALMSAVDRQGYLESFEAIAAQDPKTWTMDRADCQLLVQRLAGLSTEPAFEASMEPLLQPQRNKGGSL